jgi:hypothetical protein
MTHFHPQDPDYVCTADNEDRPEDLAAYRAVENAGRMKDGCSTTVAFRIFDAYRETLYADGKFPQGKHWNGPEMKYHVTKKAQAAWEAEQRAVASAAWAAKATTGDYVCPIGHRHLLTPEGWISIGLFVTTDSKGVVLSESSAEDSRPPRTLAGPWSAAWSD